jgi:hypothetical protein
MKEETITTTPKAAEDGGLSPACLTRLLAAIKCERPAPIAVAELDAAVRDGWFAIYQIRDLLHVTDAAPACGPSFRSGATWGGAAVVATAKPPSRRSTASVLAARLRRHQERETKRAERERALGEKISALPSAKFGVIYRRSGMAVRDLLGKGPDSRLGRQPLSDLAARRDQGARRFDRAQGLRSRSLGDRADASASA